MSALLIAEHNNKEVKPFTFNAITAASQIDQDLHVLVIGYSCESVAKSISEVPKVKKVIKTINIKVILLEAKGRFWEYAEYSKYVWIRKALPKHVELVFLFQKPDSPMPQAKKRKDGTKRTHAEWAESNIFIWYSEETLPKEWKK